MTDEQRKRLAQLERIASDIGTMNMNEDDLTELKTLRDVLSKDREGYVRDSEMSQGDLDMRNSGRGEFGKAGPR